MKTILIIWLTTGGAGAHYRGSIASIEFETPPACEYALKRDRARRLSGWGMRSRRLAGAWR